MKVLVTGVKGQLGYDCYEELTQHGIDAVGVDIEDMDITKEESVYQVLNQIKPTHIIHCAAWTAVDAAEDKENKDMVHTVNGLGTKYLANWCKDNSSPLMYISTDYVFSGQGTTPWEADCKDFAPLNVYGESKLSGETYVSSILNEFFIVRIAWVFGTNGNNFIKTMLNVGKNRKELSIVNDQIGTPTYTYDLAKLLVSMIQTKEYGYYHATNEGGYISWYDFAVEIFQQATLLGHTEYSQEELKVHPVSTKEYGVSKAARPYNSRLDKRKLVDKGFLPLPTWQDALARYLKELTLM